MIVASQDTMLLNQLESVNRAFSKQSSNYDREDDANPILRDMRQQVYGHVAKHLKPQSTILELNAGTGIDALYFTRLGHRVHATDLSTGMIHQINEKIEAHHVRDRLSCQQVSYDRLDEVKGLKFDYVFSNFGGLNCIDDLSKVTKHLPAILNPGAYITWVIMPPVYLWELLWLLKGDVKQAFRRLHKGGVMAHLEGEYFKTYYHSLSQIKKAFGPGFKLIDVEGLCTVSPPPAPGNFPHKHPGLYKALRKTDGMLRSSFPFNRWADHIIVTFQSSH